MFHKILGNIQWRGKQLFELNVTWLDFHQWRCSVSADDITTLTVSLSNVSLATECVSEYGNLRWTHTPSHDKHIGWSSSSIRFYLPSVTLLHPESVLSWCLCWSCLARWCVADLVLFCLLTHSVALFCYCSAIFCLHSSSEPVPTISAYVPELSALTNCSWLVCSLTLSLCTTSFHDIFIILSHLWCAASRRWISALVIGQVLALYRSTAFTMEL